ncbi:SusC/RagA family TonB-linked outer membrane protein [Chitinophaga barathri]|uniref:SusC/RagA family TonB-linked outer membrane protein n=1 Tax=Chitinophaga barathri TaxID=1647451 RepID=A0A3N4MKI3_9BACT|nr:SusC/RagA family TonB-linked outer membrane protein [Chitinophaga barathri]RPD40590.1 SusC/RagA family TonB-linked outer membrane protein [Chitinophaga barathri]
MKLTAFLLLAVGLHVSAAGYSQKVTLSVRDMPLQKVFEEVITQTGVSIVYSEKVLSGLRPVSLQVKDVTIQQLLDLCLKNQQVTYSLEGNSYVIKKLPEPRPGAITAAADTTIDITGRVTGADNTPLPGTTVLVKGTSKGAKTNDQGVFSLTGIRHGAVLVFSNIGFATQEAAAPSNGRALNIILQEDTKNFAEIVVVGYSAKKKSELTSAVSTVSSEQLKDVTTNDVGSMLQGKVAGLQVVNSSGVPGAAAEIRLRGVSSVNASQSPLYVVDGIIGGNFDPNDVENISVLKDAGATAMYGSQANAGVIIVTTKKGSGGKTQFEARVTAGFRTADLGKIKMMNGSQLYERHKEFYRDYIPGNDDNSYKIDLLKFYAERPRELRNQDYNWLSAMFPSAPMQNIHLSARGGNEKNDYYTSITYYNEKGTFLNTDFQRINLRGNSTHRFSKNVSVTNNINLSASSGKSFNYEDVFYAYLNMPWDNPYDANGQPVYVDGTTTAKWWSRDKTNPIHTIQNSNHPYKSFSMNYDLGLNIQITDWLSFSSTNRAAVNYNKSTDFYSPVVAGLYHNTGFLNELGILSYGFISTDLLKFSFTKGDHSISGLAGVAIENSKTESVGASGKGLPTGLSVLNVVSNSQLVNGFNDQAILQSLISQVSYGYKEKYFLTGSYRVDGSTAFPASKRYGSFPAISAAWLISNEGFLHQNRVVDNLKIRASYGVTGTQDIGSSRYLGLYSLSSQYNGGTAAIPLQLPSPDLTWESKHQLNAGIDLGLFKRVNLTLDVYNNVTKNLLLQVSQPLSVGFEQRWENAGEIVNKGVELGISSVNIKTKNFEWSTDFNINFNSNKLQKLPSDITRTQPTWSISQIYRNGGNLYEFYMPRWLGVDKETGAPLWEVLEKDADGKVISSSATSDYASATYQEVGSALPKLQGGLTSTWKYKNIGLRVNAYFLSGNKVFSNSLRFVMNDGMEPYYNQIVLPDGYSTWTKPGDDATEPSPQNAANATETSTRYLKDGGFFAIRNIALSYDLPNAWVHRIGLDGVTLSVTADNVYTFTDFLGQDPATTITSGSFVMPGVSDFKYPNNRQYLFNVNIRF